MDANSSIEWTESTWNPVTGCTRISEGCRHCYAERMARRLEAMGVEAYRNGFQVTTHEHVLPRPLSWRKPQMIFVNSMSDLFHEQVGHDFIRRTFNVMCQADWHTFQVLTKRSERLAELARGLPWPKNVWMGVTVESRDHLTRIEHLLTTRAAVKFVSFEPLLEDIGQASLRGIDWVIAGGESGPGARRMHASWVRHLRDRCLAQHVPFFFKQWGGVFKKRNGRHLDGRTWEELPTTVTQ